MSQQAGWYDDPENADNLRYWDGVQWTDHTSPKRKPGLDQAGQAAQQAWGAPPGQQPVQGGHDGAQHGYGQVHGQHDYGQQGGQEPTNPYAGGSQPPFQGQQWQPMPGGQQLQHLQAPTTPDGQPLAGWWRRVGARILDGILIAVVGGLVANQLVPGVWTDYLDWATGATDLSAQPPAQLLERLSSWSLVVGVVGLVYEVVLVKLLGGTLGKLALGLRVRLRDEPGLVGWGTSLLRGLVYQLSGIFTPIYFLNVLWPLWDEKNQALHDKVARTNVVRHR